MQLLYRQHEDPAPRPSDGDGTERAVHGEHVRLSRQSGAHVAQVFDVAAAVERRTLEVPELGLTHACKRRAKG